MDQSPLEPLDAECVWSKVEVGQSARDEHVPRAVYPPLPRMALDALTLASADTFRRHEDPTRAVCSTPSPTSGNTPMRWLP